LALFLRSDHRWTGRRWDAGSLVLPHHRLIHFRPVGAIISGLTAALHGEITVKNGRVEQGKRLRKLPIDTSVLKSIQSHG
jgi:hypothetical protein